MVQKCVGLGFPEAGDFDGIIAFKLSSVSASSSRLSVRQRLTRGKRTAMPDLCLQYCPLGVSVNKSLRDMRYCMRRTKLRRKPGEPALREPSGLL